MIWKIDRLCVYAFLDQACTGYTQSIMADAACLQVPTLAGPNKCSMEANTLLHAQNKESIRFSTSSARWPCPLVWLLPGSSPMPKSSKA